MLPGKICTFYGSYEGIHGLQVSLTQCPKLYPRTDTLLHATYFLLPPLPQSLSLPSYTLYSELTSSLKLSLVNPTQAWSFRGLDSLHSLTPSCLLLLDGILGLLYSAGHYLIFCIPQTCHDCHYRIIPRASWAKSLFVVNELPALGPTPNWQCLVLTPASSEVYMEWVL